MVELAGGVGPAIPGRLGTSRRLYEEAAGVGPAGVTQAAASIHSRRAQQMRQGGISVCSECACRQPRSICQVPFGGGMPSEPHGRVAR